MLSTARRSPGAHLVAEEQNQARNSGRKADGKDPQYRARCPLPFWSGGKQAAQAPIQSGDEFADEDDGMGKSVGITHEEIDDKPDHKGHEGPFHCQDSLGLVWQPFFARQAW